MDIIQNQISTDDVLYLVGRVFPGISLIISMTLRFVPLYKKKVELSFQKIGERPVGDQPFDSLIVQAARNAYEALGITPEFIEKGSLDANIPISMGIPGLGLESGGETGGAHSLNEWYIPSDIATGQSKLILLLMGLLGVEGFSDPLLPKRNP